MISFMLTCGEWIVVGAAVGSGVLVRRATGALVQVSPGTDLNWSDGSREERTWTDLGYVWKWIRWQIGYREGSGKEKLRSTPVFLT